jgi:hypothetical protein
VVDVSRLPPLKAIASGLPAIFLPIEGLSAQSALSFWSRHIGHEMLKCCLRLDNAILNHARLHSLNKQSIVHGSGVIITP